MDKKEFVLKAVADKKDLIVEVSDKIFDYAEKWESAACRRHLKLHMEQKSR